MPGHKGVRVTFPSLGSKSWLLGHAKSTVPNIKVKWSVISLPYFCLNLGPRECFD